MKEFGVRFRINNRERFKTLQTLFYEIKRDKEVNEFRDPQDWIELIPESVRLNFIWPDLVEREEWLSRKPFTPIAISPVTEQLNQRWDFFRVFESFEEVEYDLLFCEMIDLETAEIHISPWAYPYGGLGSIIALVEAYGFFVLGFNECGSYQLRE